MIVQTPDLFAPPEHTVDRVIPWKPRPLSHDQWPPSYKSVYAWRIETLKRLRADSKMLASAEAYYAERPAEWIGDWCETYNPRKKTGKWMPFVLFQRQAEYVDFLEELRRDSESGLVEKCRDIGATWIGCAYSVWCMRFIPSIAIGWGSRKEDLVDKQGDPDSIFEKMRLLMSRLPVEFRPNYKNAFMKFVNKDNGAVIAGEAGDGIGRGGRKTFFVVDEAAHVPRSETLEASLGDNTDVRIDMSSVNGTNNMFYTRRESGVVWEPGKRIEPGMVRVFIFDWRDHPEKTQEWYDQRRAKALREGTMHILAQEVDRNYSAAIENTLIKDEWVRAAIDAHLRVPYLRAHAQSEEWMAGLDVADKGKDKTALTIRQGIVLRHASEWGDRDPGVSTRQMITMLREQGRRGIAVQYDAIGMGVNVRSEYNRLIEDGLVTWDEIRMIPWNAGASVIRPFERIIPDDDASTYNKDFFHNFRAQAAWSVSRRFYKTWRAVEHGEVYPAEDLISISSDIPLDTREKLMRELCQPTRGQSTASLRMLVDKLGDGVKSPNLFDATIQNYFPAPEDGAQVHVGSLGG